MRRSLCWLLLGCCLVFLSAEANGRTVDNRVGAITPGEPRPQPHRTERSLFLDVPHMRQEKNLCVPTSAAMVLQYYGDARSPRELKVRSRGWEYDPNKPFSDFTLTFYSDLLRGLQPLGYGWQVANYSTRHRGFTTGMEEIKQELRRGNPVLVDTSLYRGHTFVVAGFDEEQELLFVVDPNLPRPGLRAIRYAQFEQIWNSRDVGFDGRGAIFTRPK
jgi:uncharacterized protein YvpB